MTDDPWEGEGGARDRDPDTAKWAAQFITAKATTARVLLAEAFASLECWTKDGFTDYEACLHAGLSIRSEYATRCSELRNNDIIATTGQTRPGETPTHRVVSIITPYGEAQLRKRKER